MLHSNHTDESTMLVRRALDLYELHLIQYATNLLNGDIDEARDVVQDTFLKLFQADPHKINEFLKAWLYRVCRNRCYDLMRKQKWLTFQNEDWLLEQVDDTPLPYLEMDAEVLGKLLWANVANLSIKEQEVIRLKFVHDCSYQEIAKTMGMTTSNVGFCIYYCIRKLRTQLKNTDLFYEH
jgi:RNA polymerase sigma-70 factor (ECF subfamily)